GLGGSQFNYRSYHKMRSGVLFFGGIHHLTYFHPDSIRHNAYQAPVVITGLQLFNKEVEFQDAEGPLTQPIDQLDHLTLTYQDRAISLEFVTLDYTMPSLNQYAFMLEGFHEGWQYVGTQRMATFTNLSPGTYTFKVKGTNADGVWSGQAATLNLEILPPFWRTNWAILTYVLIGLGLLFGLRKFTHAQWTLKHNLRLERMRREKIEELNQAKLAFFTNVSHELRTPLTMIMGPLEQLKRIGQKNPEASEQLNLMHRNADRLLRLINQLLDFTKVDTSVQEPNLAYGEVRSTIQQIVIPFKDFAVRQKVHFLEKTAFSALWMNLDQEKLDKILYNLLSNAFKFTPQGGQVKLSMWVEEKENGPYLHLGVADTGVGIPGEEKAKIFDRFYQGENGSRIQEVGTGIGLALTMELVRVLGGEIEVESEEGRGTNFIVSLPLGEGYELKEMDAGMEEHILASPVARPSVPFMVAEAISGNPQEVGERPKVLIIEDNPDVRTFLRLSLEQQFLIEEAVSGEEGLLVMQDSTPDLVVCDVMMPQMDGIEVTKRIKSNLRYSHVPVILLTAQTALEYKLQGLEMGADDYIAKPFHPEILRARIHNLISNRRQLHHRFVQMNPFAEVQLTANPTDERFMRSVLELMHERMGDPGFSVKELASAIGMSHSVLYRKIKGLTGLNAKEFMVNLRLHKAAQLLKQPGIKVSEVAFEVGFNDPRYFSTAFRKQFKLSPSQYMAQGQE
ncbi:MAG: hybrid sensor histidine kinase/response regulator transcription factor, partial [Bacteroidota bacterium]